MIFIWYLLLSWSAIQPDQRNPYCDVFGSVYEVDDILEADLVVFESTEGSADVIVYEQTNRLYADRRGMWYFEQNADFSQYKIYFTDREREADFTVHFTQFESFAGCNE